MTEYTPSAGEVREEYVYGAQDVDMDGHVVVSFDEACARWDRFLARVRRDAAREALDGIAGDFDLWGGVMDGDEVARRIRHHRDTHYPEGAP